MVLRLVITADTSIRCGGDLNKTRKSILSNTLYKKFLPKVKNLPENMQMYWAYYKLWPNLAFDVYPDQMDFMQFIPISASKTIIREIPYALKDNRREMQAARYLNWRINRQVNAEDTQLIKWVQEGMETSGFTKGPLAKSEVCLIDSVKKIQDAIPVAGISNEPPKEDIFAINNDLLKKISSKTKINKIF
jgi:hypothetical protein